MPDIFYLLSKWWKQVLTVVLLSLLTAALIVFFSPKKYLSVTTALPASSFTADKARIFNENIQELYSVLGTADDLDMITGTGKLDTIYLAITDQFNLANHYSIKEKEEAARSKAACILKKNSRVMKSEYGELKVKVWNKNRELAAQLANALMNKIHSIHQDLQNQSNKATLESLEKAKRELQQQADSAGSSLPGHTFPTEQVKKYETLITQYQLMTNSKPLVLLIVEKARAANVPDKPKPLTVLLSTAFLSLLFGILLALYMEKRN